MKANGLITDEQIAQARMQSPSARISKAVDALEQAVGKAEAERMKREGIPDYVKQMLQSQGLNTADISMMESANKPLSEWQKTLLTQAPSYL